ncbi:MAG: hypothetical protein AAFY73_12800 [Pseudomonadota bacterium]
MFFALGASVAGLVALWLAPMVWRRAVRVTERRVEAAIPLSIHEVQADKDQMRADFAVQLRKVEQKSEKLQSKAAEDRVTINEQLSRIDALVTDRRAKAEMIADLEDRHEAQQMELIQVREKATQLRSDLNARDARLKERGERIRALETSLREQENARNAARIELAALETRGEDIGEKLRAASKVVKALKESNAELKKTQREQQVAMRKLERERDKMQGEVDRFRSNVIDLEERLDRRKAELARLKGQPVPVSSGAKARKAADVSASATRKKVAAAAVDTPSVSSAAEEGAIASQLADFQSEIEKLGGAAPKTAAQRKKLVSQMDKIVVQITAANASDTAEIPADKKKLKGFKKPVKGEKGATQEKADNDRVGSLSDRISGLHNLPAAE